jgi:hypothetical protein
VAEPTIRGASSALIGFAKCLQEMDSFQGFPGTSGGRDLQSHRYEGFENGDGDSDEESDPYGPVSILTLLTYLHLAC